MSLDARERLIVALDVPSVAEAEAMIARLGETVSFYKIGYQLAFAGGIDFARVLLKEDRPRSQDAYSCRSPAANSI